MKSLNEIIPIESVQERDTDLLIVEELYSNPEFISWFISKIDESIKDYKFEGVWHSLTQVGLGESDIAFQFSSKQKTYIVLIENKIDANFQNRQAERYLERGENRIKENQCDVFYTVLIAPKRYVSKGHGFQHAISYEEIKQYFVDSKTLSSERSSYKAFVLESAIEKLRRGYSPIIDEESTNFWWDYYEFACKFYPHLKMRKPPSGIPKGSGFMVFEPTDCNLTKNDQIIHKGYGAFDIQLGGKASELDYFTERFKNKISDEMEIVKAGKSLSFRIKSSKVEFDKSFDSQIELMKTNFEKINFLYLWAKKNL